MTKYDQYNREERALCAHLFRLLHERMEEKEASPLGQFLAELGKSELFKNGNLSLQDLKFENVAIFCEVSIIREYYERHKPNVLPFMDQLVEVVMRQEGINNCKSFSQIFEITKNLDKINPYRIMRWIKSGELEFSCGEKCVYKAVQGMFNAKPDLMITVDNNLLACEIKFTEGFKEKQLRKTKKMTEVWASLLFDELGFSKRPNYTVFKLGAEKYDPDINWQQIFKISEKTFPPNDRTRIAIKSGFEILKN